MHPAGELTAVPHTDGAGAGAAVPLPGRGGGGVGGGGGAWDGLGQKGFGLVGVGWVGKWVGVGRASTAKGGAA